MIYGHMRLMVIAGWICAVFVMELEDNGRVWAPGLWAFIGVAGHALFCFLGGVY